MAISVVSGSVGHVTFGTSSVFNILGDLSAGIWLFLGASGGWDINDGILSRGASGETEDANACIQLDMQAGGDVRYIHENGTGINSQNTFDTNLANGTWTYIGISRNATSKTVVLYTGNGSTLAANGTYTYTNNPTGGTNTGAALVLFASVGTSSALDDARLANFTYHSRALTQNEHYMQMLGMVPQGNLLVWAPLWGNEATQVNYAGNAINGTASGTWSISSSNPPVRAPFLMADYSWVAPVSVQSGQTTFTGTGSFAAQGYVKTFGTVTFTGAGSFTSSGVTVVLGTTTFIGTGILTPQGHAIVFDSASFTGMGGLSIINTPPSVISYWGGTLTLTDTPLGAITLSEALRNGLVILDVCLSTVTESVN